MKKRSIKSRLFHGSAFLPTRLRRVQGLRLESKGL